MIFTRACEYGFQTILYLAVKEKNGKNISIKEIAERQEISFSFLGKVIQELVSNNLVKSTKGPNGGVKLAKTPSEITLYEIVSSFDENKVFEKCILGFPNCGIDNPCPVHEDWSKIRNSLKETLENKSVAQIIEESKGKDIRFISLP